MERIKKGQSRAGQNLLTGVCLAVLAGLFALWWWQNPPRSPYAQAAALLSAGLFALLGVRFIPQWMKAWRGESEGGQLAQPDRATCFKLFAVFLLAGALYYLAGYLLQMAAGRSIGTALGFDAWVTGDVNQYQDIARRGGYLSEGPWDQLVQLVFFPGYPMLVRAFSWLVQDYLAAAFVVSALSAAGAACVLYKLARIDLPVDAALKTVKFQLILPGAFSLWAPMSDSLFLLLTLSCLYLARRRRFVLAGLLGACASFTRLPGLLVLVPVLFEGIADTLRQRPPLSKTLGRLAALLLIPLGFAAYCGVNYAVSGDPLRFLYYQSEHWGQRLGYFFNTAAYQADYAVSYLQSGDVQGFMGLWLPNLLYHFAALGVMAAAVKRVRPSYTAYFIAYFIATIGATWLLSGPRYLMAAFPLSFAVAALAQKRWADRLATGLCLVANGLYFYAYLAHWAVY